MRDGRSRIILLSVAVADSVWLYALLATFGVITGLHGSPLPWLSVFALLLVAIIVGFVLAGTEGDDATLAIWQALFGVVVIYVLIGTGPFVTDGSINLAWLVGLVRGDYVAEGIASVVIGLLVSIWMWRHGLKLATNSYPEDRLAGIFKIGIAVLAVAVLVDQAADDDIGAGALLIPFFGATLVGLAVGRLPESGVAGNAGRWARVIATTVFGVMGLGLAIGLLGGLYGNGGVRLLYAGWGLFVDGVLWVLRYPIAGIALFFEWFFNLFGTRTVEEGQQVQQQSGQEILGVEPSQAVENGDTAVDTVVNILQYPVIILLILVTFFLLAMAYRRFGKRDNDDDGDERESIRGDANAAGDLTRLLSGLVPGWLKSKQRYDRRYPDQPGFAEVFRLYFDTIALGIKWGVNFDPNMTPDERMPMLESALPGAPVREVTARFNAACYGAEPTAPSAVLELEARMRMAERSIRES